MKRKAKEEPLGPPVLIKSRRFGWCVDEQHEGCRLEFRYYEKTYQCSCKCHEESTPEEESKSAKRKNRQGNKV